MAIKLLRHNQAAKAFGVSRTTFWRWTRTPGFPRGFRLSAGVVAFAEDELKEWAEAHRQARVA